MNVTGVYCTHVGTDYNNLNIVILMAFLSFVAREIVQMKQPAHKILSKWSFRRTNERPNESV